MKSDECEDRTRDPGLRVQRQIHYTTEVLKMWDWNWLYKTLVRNDNSYSARCQSGSFRSVTKSAKGERREADQNLG